MARRRDTKELLVRELARFRRALAAVGRVPDERRIHRLRVASRRARASIRLLARKLPDDLTRPMRSFFRALSEASGPARDFDVALERLTSGGDAPSTRTWIDARTLARARLTRHAIEVAPEWRRIERAILASGARRRGKVEKRWRKRLAAQRHDLEELRRRLAARLRVAEIHAWRRRARRLRYEAEIAEDAGLAARRAFASAKAIHRGAAEIVDLAMIARLAKRLGDRSFASVLHTANDVARRAVTRLVRGEDP